MRLDRVGLALGSRTSSIGNGPPGPVGCRKTRLGRTCSARIHVHRTRCWGRNEPSVPGLSLGHVFGRLRTTLMRGPGPRPRPCCRTAPPAAFSCMTHDPRPRFGTKAACTQGHSQLMEGAKLPPPEFTTSSQLRNRNLSSQNGPKRLHEESLRCFPCTRQGSATAAGPLGDGARQKGRPAGHGPGRAPAPGPWRAHWSAQGVPAVRRRRRAQPR